MYHLWHNAWTILMFEKMTSPKATWQEHTWWHIHTRHSLNTLLFTSVPAENLCIAAYPNIHYHSNIEVAPMRLMLHGQQAYVASTYSLSVPSLYRTCMGKHTPAVRPWPLSHGRWLHSVCWHTECPQVSHFLREASGFTSPARGLHLHIM
jgi:hypothetical protein